MDLRDKPGRQSGYVYAAQRELMKKHHEAKSRIHSVSGVVASHGRHEADKERGKLAGHLLWSGGPWNHVRLSGMPW